MLGSIIAAGTSAIGGILGSRNKRKESKQAFEQQLKLQQQQQQWHEHMTSPEKVTGDRDKVIGHELGNSGLYKDYAGLRGKLDREYMQSKFSELNPWELAGAQGQQGFSQAIEAANDVAKESSKGANARYAADSAANTQMALAKVNAITQYKIAELNAQTSRLNTQDQVAAQNAMVEPNKAKIQSDIESAISQRGVNDAQIRKNAQDIVESEARVRNIDLSGSQIQAMTDEVYQRIKESKQRIVESDARVGNINAQTGKTYIDTENAQAELNRQPLKDSQLSNEVNKTRYGSSIYDVRGLGNAASDLANSAAQSVKKSVSDLSGWISARFDEYEKETGALKSQYLKHRK